MASEVAVYDIKAKLIESGLEIKDAETLLTAYGMPLTEAGELLTTYQAIKVDDVSQTAEMAQARDVRIKLKNIRIGVKKRHDELKADILKQGKAIDFVERTVRQFIEPAEQYLEQQEKFAELKEKAEREELIRTRAEKLLRYTPDISMYNLAEMTPAQFNKVLADAKDEAELAAEQAAAAERERAAQLETERQARMAAEAEAAEAKAEAQAAQEAADKLRREQEAAAAEKRAAEAKELAEQKRKAQAPDKQKLHEALDAIVLSTPQLHTDTGRALAAKISKHLTQNVEMYRKLIEEQL